MLKYVNCGIVFQEVPDEVSLAINLSNCPNNCAGCHSDYLKKDVGSELSPESLKSLVEPYRSGITCVAFMGGDGDTTSVMNLANWIKEEYDSSLKVAWYSGKKEIPEYIDVRCFNYIKLGPYMSGFGPLKEKTTNQRMYKIDEDGKMNDITSRFWKK